MKILFTTFLVLIHFFSCNKTNAQDPHFTQFYVSPLYTNTANAGTAQLDGKQAARFGLQLRNDNASNLNQLNFSYDQYINKIHGGIGLNYFSSDSANGKVKNNNIGITYAYHLILNKKRNLQLNSAFGAEINFVNYAKDYFKKDTILVFFGPTSPQYQYALSYPNAHAGLLLTSNKFTLGLSIHNLIQPNVSPSKSPDQIITVRFTVNGAYLFQFSKFSITPMFQIQKQRTMENYTFKDLSLNVNAKYKMFVLGIGYRNYYYKQHTINSINSNLGINIKNIKVIYSIDKINIQNNSKYAHELSLIYLIKTKKNITTTLIQ